MATTTFDRMGLKSSLLTVGQAAALLHVHPNTLRRWEAMGLVRAYRVGPRHDRRFSRVEVEQMLGSQEQLMTYNGEGRGLAIAPPS